MNPIPFCFDQRLDREFLQSVYDDDLEHATEIFSLFVDMAPGLLKDMEASFSLGEWEELRCRVHQIKPTFSFVGLTQLTKNAEKLEQGCTRTPDGRYLNELYDEFKNNYARGFPIVERELERLKNQINQRL